MVDFQRDISMTFNKRGDSEIVITNTMNDRFHDIVLEVVVNYGEQTIKDIQVDFRRSPAPGCGKVKERLSLLIGTRVGWGLTKRLFEALGGARGCTNLRNMLLCSLPIVLNLKAGDGASGEREILESIHEKLTGTCAGYAEGLEKNR